MKTFQAPQTQSLADDNQVNPIVSILSQESEEV